MHFTYICTIEFVFYNSVYEEEVQKFEGEADFIEDNVLLSGSLGFA